MDSTLKMASLLRTLRTCTNGAVVGAMEARGVSYGLSYGVSVVDIKRAAGPYTPDHGLAVLLYKQQVRELRIAAAYIADPAKIHTKDIAFWAGGLESGEIAEHISILISRCPAAQEAVYEWLASEKPLEAYAALMTAARIAMGVEMRGWDFARIIDLIQQQAATRDYLIGKGITALVPRLWQKTPDSRRYLAGFLDMLRNDGSYSAIWNELEWLIENE